MRLCTTIASLAVLALPIGCDKKPASAPSESSGSGIGKQTTETPPPPPKSEPAKPPPPAYAGPEISNDKNFLGLTLPPQGHWKPEFDADAKVAKWSDDDYFTGIVIRIVSEDLDTIDDLKSAAPMMMQLGTAIKNVREDKKTDKGWYAIVELDEGAYLVYVRKFGKTTVCSAMLTKPKLGGKVIPNNEALKACESYEPNPKG